MRIAILENTGKDFYSSRVKFCKFLIENGHEVYAIVPKSDYSQKISNSGINIIDINIDVRSSNPTTFIFYARHLHKVFRQNNFDVVHCFRVQPNFIGCFIAYYNRVEVVIGHITGLGIAFTYNTLRLKLIRLITILGYQFLNKILKIPFITQNNYDPINLGLNSFEVILGSSVDENVFFPSRNNQAKDNDRLEKDDPLTLLFASRLLKSKGLMTIINGILALDDKSRNKIILLVAGTIDSSNSDSLSIEEINNISNYTFVRYLGYRDDIPSLIHRSHVCILPTKYREGTPRFLLQSMACAKPIITSASPRCDHLINKSKNGFIVNDKNISDTILKLFNADLKIMGENSYNLYVEKFSENIVFNNILKMYLDNSVHKY